MAKENKVAIATGGRHVDSAATLCSASPSEACTRQRIEVSGGMSL